MKKELFEQESGMVDGGVSIGEMFPEGERMDEETAKKALEDIKKAIHDLEQKIAKK